MSNDKESHEWEPPHNEWVLTVSELGVVTHTEEFGSEEEATARKVALHAEWADRAGVTPALRPQKLEDRARLRWFSQVEGRWSERRHQELLVRVAQSYRDDWAKRRRVQEKVGFLDYAAWEAWKAENEHDTDWTTAFVEELGRD